MPGLLKLNPDVVELPKPCEGGKNILKHKLHQDSNSVPLEAVNTSYCITNIYQYQTETVQQKNRNPLLKLSV